MRNFILSCVLVAAALLPAQADEVKSTVLAFDRVAKIIVLDDKTVWQLADDTQLSDDLKAGDTVIVDFESAGENGVAKVFSVTLSTN